MYYQGTSDNIHQAADGNIQTLYLMNPNYIHQGYSNDTQQQQHQHQHHQQQIIRHAPLQQAQQHFVGVPLPAVSLHDQNHAQLIHRLWNQSGGGGGNGSHHQSQIIPSSTVVSATSCGGSTTDLASQLGFQRPIIMSPTQQQQQQGGLSLSLSPQQQQISFNNISAQNQVGSNINRGLDGISSMVLGSKYLKAAQELLDEVVNVGKCIKGSELEKGELMNKESILPLASDVNTSNSGGESSSKQKNGVAELTTAQRQEFQMKKAKLVTMLEEVEQRYRQYHHQMQIIVSSFEQVAGIGSAKSYTQLALHAISKQFRCLKDAIVGQIKATSKSLGEEDQSLGEKIEGSRLKFVDHHLRQQRALQQLGMMQPNAWRPQRGLPERAVSVLRAWLFEHFLHPYPKDSDKIMLAKQTGLTRSQVSNWFINARVRLWKPMVEEMYLEEMKNNQEQNSSSEENKNKNESNKEKMVSKSSAPQESGTPTEIATSTISTPPTACGSSFQAAQAHNFSFLGSLNMENNTTTKKPRNHDMHNNSPSNILSSVDMAETKARDHQSKKGFNPLMDAAAVYTMGEFGRFNPHEQMAATNFHGNNGVSLTLGLPPNSENLSQQSYQNTIEFNRMSYENIDFQNKRFPSQILPDFVAGNLGT
ncbi:BEL1-like homeodomain protein 1 [Nicotiana sylvestris]|uniref:BEL1-like homeodomain protein 1 n=1 Tax=Nicotiana sylvestris TaxID=4096 RepID=A0A1U7WGY1_NICSY|nr:PREDICTED: BEL1-like homeodomain protein 1 [Nicotiana sylvestris]XP_009773900.1 PREDICTED: BEL1-like homeodomain protein 1 [Nicotiana sylvestris]